MSLEIYALHGFLGLPTDWLPFPLITHPFPIAGEHLTLQEWASHFNASIAKTPSKKILIGYSLGGRLALHALVDNPSLWAGAIIISANPGIDDSGERIKRIEKDREWAEKFLIDPWQDLITGWNKQPLFCGASFPSPRLESDFNRKALSQQLINWSIGTQDPLWNSLATLPLPILYLAGEKDKKYAALAERFSSFTSAQIIPGAGHRVPWDQPSAFIRSIDYWFNLVR